MTESVRWKQRFSNYEKAFKQLSEAVDRGEYNELEQAGLIQIFEVVFELGWKTLRDKLEYDGFKANSPRETIKIAFRNGYISDGELWIDALDHRNLLSHTYDEAKSNEARDLIRGRYFILLKDLHSYLRTEADR